LVRQPGVGVAQRQQFDLEARMGQGQLPEHPAGGRSQALGERGARTGQGAGEIEQPIDRGLGPLATLVEARHVVLQLLQLPAQLQRQARQLVGQALVLGRETLELGQALLDPLQAVGVDHDRVREAGQGSLTFLQVQARLVQFLPRFAQGFDARTPVLEAAFQVAQAVDDRRLVGTQAMQPLPQVRAQPIGMPQGGALALQLFELAGHGFQAPQLVDLEAQQVEAISAFALFGFEGLEPRHFLEGRFARLDVALQERLHRTELVQQLALVIGFEQALVGVLPVDLEHQGGQFAEALERHRLAVDVAATATAALEGAAQDQLVAQRSTGAAFQFDQGQVLGQVVAHALGRGRAQLEASRHTRPRRSLAHPGGGATPRSLPQQEFQRGHQQALARTGLPGEGVQARSETQLCVIDQRQVGDLEVGQHR
jgi:hypothetical protein